MDVVDYIEGLMKTHSDIGAVGLDTSLPREVAEELTERGYPVSGRNKEWVVRSKTCKDRYQAIPCYSLEIEQEAK